MTTATRTPKNEKIEAVEAMPKFPPDSVEAQALARLRAHYKIEPGPLPALGAQADVSFRSRAEAIANACQAWQASGYKEGYFARSVVKDSEPLGQAALAGMARAIEKHGRVAIGDAAGEWQVISGAVEARVGHLPAAVQRAAGELYQCEKRLAWLYGQLPPAVASHWPTPPGAVGRRLHARRAALIADLDRAFSEMHDPAGAGVVNGILSPPHPGTPSILHAARGWATIALAIKSGGEFPPEFAADWGEVIPEAADSFAELGELAAYILRCV